MEAAREMENLAFMHRHAGAWNCWNCARELPVKYYGRLGEIGGDLKSDNLGGNQNATFCLVNFTLVHLRLREGDFPR